MLRIIKTIANLIFGDIIYFFSCLIPKNQNVWIFGSWGGEKYSDNSKYLFEYINENHPEIRAIWIVKNREVKKVLQKKNYEVYTKNSLKSVLVSLRAGVCIVTVSVSRDLNLYFGPNTKIVQLWHGTPLKKILLDARPPSMKLKLLKILFPFLKEDISILIASSEEIRENLATAFDIGLEKIKVTGYPRNDGLFFKEEMKSNNSKKGVYLPTFRNEYDFNIFKNNFNFEIVENTLQRLDTHLYLQLHPLDNPSTKFKRLLLSSEFIHIIEFDDIYSNLKDFDFLITDYSSIFFDFLLLERPIIFAPFDLEIYLEKERDLYYDYNSITPGPKAKDWNELLYLIEESIDNPEKYSKDILRTKKMFNKYDDGKSSQRVFNEIKMILDKY